MWSAPPGSIPNNLDEPGVAGVFFALRLGRALRHFVKQEVGNVLMINYAQVNDYIDWVISYRCMYIQLVSSVLPPSSIKGCNSYLLRSQTI